MGSAHDATIYALRSFDSFFTGATRWRLEGALSLEGGAALLREGWRGGGGACLAMTEEEVDFGCGYEEATIVMLVQEL